MCYQSSCYPGVENLMRTRWYISRAPTPVVEQDVARVGEPQGTMKQCLCSPTTHPGSFRCRNHHDESTLGCYSTMSLSHITILSDYDADNIGSSTSHVILSDLEATVIATLVIVPEISPEAPPSPDYVPASHGYVPESNLEESPEEDPLDEDFSSNDVDERDGLEIWVAPTPPAPLQIVPAPPTLPRRPAILVQPKQAIPFSRPYRIHRNGVCMIVRAPSALSPATEAAIA
nr:hypothetical protein [Tanacetum cinerariifolium]